MQSTFVIVLLLLLFTSSLYMCVHQQYRNPGNPLAHYDGTGNEIIAQTGGILYF